MNWIKIDEETEFVGLQSYLVYESTKDDIHFVYFDHWCNMFRIYSDSLTKLTTKEVTYYCIVTNPKQDE